jgi:nitrite reductase (NADH) small subunit
MTATDPNEPRTTASNTACALELPLGPLSQIPPGEGRNFDAAGERVAVFHTRSGEVFATQANCPHKKGPLADGLVGSGTVICPLHAWKFNLATGESASPPPGQPGGGACKLKTYPVRVTEQGLILLTLWVPEMAGPVM